MSWLAAMLLTSGVLAQDPVRTLTFARADLGKVPTGWKAEQTGKGEGSVWKLVADETTPSKSGIALAQTAESPGPMFNLCVAQETRYRDLELTVAFKAVRGKNDQGGGLVWRYHDANNYYIARMNPLEDNYRLYKVVAGKRIQFAGKEGLKIPAGEWHTLKVRQVGDRIECYLDGKKELQATDTTFEGAGKVGLWTKSDAQTYFDALQVRRLDKDSPP